MGRPNSSGRHRVSMNEAPFESQRLARNTPGAFQHDAEPQIDMRRMRAYRLGRVQQMLQERDLAGILLYDPINVRYANGSSDMQVWILHNQHRYCWVPAQGLCTLFEYGRALHLARHLETIRDIRPATVWTFFSAGDRIAERVGLWAAELDEVMRESGAGANRRIAADHLDVAGARELEALGWEIHNGQEVMELARAIKSDDEIACMVASISVCEAGMAKMQREMRAGIT